MLRARAFSTVLFAFALGTACSTFRGSDSRPSASAEIERLTRSSPATTFGVAIRPLDGTGLTYESDSQRLLHPASALKLLIAASIIDFGLLDAKAITKLLVERDGSAVLLEGGGDPFLSTTDLRALLATADQKVSGGFCLGQVVLVDSSHFDGIPFGTGWMWDDEPNAFMPWVSALTLDSGAFTVRAQYSSDPSGTCELVFDPPGARHFEIETHVEMSPPRDTQTLVIRRDTLHDRRHLDVFGSLARGASEEATFSIPEPDLFVGEVFATLAAPERLEANRPTIARLDPADRPRFAEVARVERPFREILTRMLKQSDNLAAECMLRQLSRIADRASPGSAALGIQAIQDYIARLGFDPQRYRIVDGSGLSFYNALDAELLLAVLLDMARRDTYAEFRAMLPAGGIDGTLAKRFTNDDAKGHLNAKTGTLAGASALAGYVDSKSGETYAFAILASNYVGPAAPWRAQIDAIAEQLADE